MLKVTFNNHTCHLKFRLQSTDSLIINLDFNLLTHILPLTLLSLRLNLKNLNRVTEPPKPVPIERQLKY